MRTELVHERGRVTARLHPDEEDRVRGALGRLAVGSVSWTAPPGWRPDHAHPDTLAAALVLLLARWTKRRMAFSRPISRALAEAVHAGFGIDAGPVDESLAPRSVGEGRPALAFSGGVDSTAALSLMPAGTLPVFVLRAAHPERTGSTSYRPDAALGAVRRLATGGRDALALESDLEWLGELPGVPSDLAWAAPVLASADALGVDSVAFGTILESAFMSHGTRYRDYFASTHFARFAPLLRAAGVALCLPVAGLSEVTTTAIVEGRPDGALAQSCVRGQPGSPCRRCFKCFRKSLIGRALGEGSVGGLELLRWLNYLPVRRELAEHPVHHHDVLAFAFANVRGRSRSLAAMTAAIGARELETGFLRRHYRAALALVPERYRGEVARALVSARVEPMSERDEAALRAFDAAAGYRLPDGAPSVLAAVARRPAYRALRSVREAARRGIGRAPIPDPRARGAAERPQEADP